MALSGVAYVRSQLIDRALARTGPNALLLATAAELGYRYHDQVNTHA